MGQHGFLSVIEAEKGLPYPHLEQKCSATSYCQLQLHFVLYMMRWKTYAKPCQNSVCMKSSRMTFPGSWISATHLFKNKFISLNTLFNSAECNITKGKSILFPCLKVLLGHGNSGGLNVTIMYKPKKIKGSIYPSSFSHSKQRSLKCLSLKKKPF
jgi:hypothetical protein